ncbi:MAG: putative membrane protein YedE/YeeE [Paracoccaceae bacterium]|jgi:uncharacterized membrane protein YedE/YeeE
MATATDSFSFAEIPNRLGVGFSLIISSVLFLFLTINYGWRQAALFVVGLSAGIILYHAAFGFTAAWRNIVTTGRGAGLRAQMIMLAVTVVIFVPLISQGEFAGTSLRGNVNPLSLGVICGAFMFGIGMQLGGGCASGTLFTVGGGNARMLVTLVFFIAGSVLGTLHWDSWQSGPSLASFSLLENYGGIGAVGISLIMFGVVWFASAAYEKHRHGSLSEETKPPFSLLRGPWPLIAGALALAVVNALTLLLAGRPWGVTSGFALWGAKLGSIFGLDVSGWAYWERAGQAASLDASVLSNITSVMNFGIILGALLAAGMAGKFAPSFKLPMRSLVAAVIGGLLLGYGARIAYGCNIGAYFGGIASTSMHGWLWFVAAFVGSTLGTRLRPVFGLV